MDVGKSFGWKKSRMRRDVICGEWVILREKKLGNEDEYTNLGLGDNSLLEECYIVIWLL